MSALYTLGFVGWVATLVWFASRRRPGFASWHMFTRLSRCHLDLVHEDGSAFNAWLYTPHTQLAMTAAGLELLLAYMRMVRNTKLHGTVEIVEGFDVRVVDVKDSRVVG
jgi:hypothetical protein